MRYLSTVSVLPTAGRRLQSVHPQFGQADRDPSIEAGLCTSVDKVSRKIFLSHIKEASGIIHSVMWLGLWIAKVLQ